MWCFLANLFSDQSPNPIHYNAHQIKCDTLRAVVSVRIFSLTTRRFMVTACTQKWATLQLVSLSAHYRLRHIWLDAIRQTTAESRQDRDPLVFNVEAASTTSDHGRIQDHLTVFYCP